MLRIRDAAIALLVVLVLSLNGWGCAPPGSNFPAASPRDEAECRNVMRLIANSCYHGEGLGVALVCRSQAGDAYDDCMVAKGNTRDDS